MCYRAVAAALAGMIFVSPASAAGLIRYDFTGVGTACFNGCRIQDGTSTGNTTGYFIFDPSLLVTSSSGTQSYLLEYIDPLIGRSQVSASLFGNVLSFDYLATDPSAVRYRYNVSFTFDPDITDLARIGIADILSSSYGSSIGANFISGGFESQGGSLVNFRAATVSSANDRYARFSTAQGVPEPSTWMTMLLGFGAIGFSMRRRQQTPSQALHNWLTHPVRQQPGRAF